MNDEDTPLWPVEESSSDTGYSLSLKQAAKRLDVSLPQIRRLVSRGALDARRFPNGWRIRPGRDSVDKRLNTDTLTLWHGTSENLHHSILKQGFKARTRKKQVWFTEKHARARKHALGRAESRGSRPVVLTCEISLVRYPHFWNPSPDVYVFAHPIDMDVIKRVEFLETVVSAAGERPKTHASVPDVLLTPTSGPSGSLYAVNEYMKLNHLQCVASDHPVVDAMTHWVEDQFSRGRLSPVTGAEIGEYLDVYLFQSGIDT